MTTGTIDRKRNDVEPPFVMTCPRLHPFQVILLLLASGSVLFLGPLGWQSFEPFHPESSYRVPFEFSNDYQLCRQVIHRSVQEEAVLLLGDSVIWGEYTEPDATLAQCLQSICPPYQFVNGGINGLHPIALEGLIRHYGQDIQGQQVLVHCNLLWLTSPERDLSSAEAQSFNHEKLVPQFSSRWPFVRSSVPSYQAGFSERFGNVIDRWLRYRQLVDHVRDVDFDGRDLHAWTIAHPYKSPLGEIRLETPQPKDELRHVSRGWQASGSRLTNFAWVTLETSRQWTSFMSAVELLISRRNKVLVLVGPFNSHLLHPESRRQYEALREQVLEVLTLRQMNHVAPAVLDSELYGDASHPLAEGYRALAATLVESKTFQDWLE